MKKIKARGILKFPRCNYDYFGQAIGIINLNPERGTYPPGCVENASTFDFGIQYKRLHLPGGLQASGFLTEHPTPETEEDIVNATKELEKEGVRAIGTTCGFTVWFQDKMTEAVEIPVASSSLLQIPLVSKLIGKNKRVGIITFNSRYLTEEYLRRSGVDESTKIGILGLENVSFEKYPEKKTFHDQLAGHIELERKLEILEEYLVYAAQQLVSKYSDIGAIILECHELAVGAYAIQKATGLPVFDVTTLLNWTYSGIVRKRFEGFM
jgi:Asp/Glu/hydantoin racemase